MVKALTRMEWLRVLARGFQGECVTPERTWQKASWKSCSSELGREHPAAEVDRRWRMDLLDAFSYMRTWTAGVSRPRRRCSTAC